MKINLFRYSYSCEIKWAFSVIISNQLLINWCPPLANTFLRKLITVEWYSQTWYISMVKKKLFHPISLHYFFFQFYHANEYMPSRIIIVKSSNVLKVKSFKLSRWCFSHYKFSMIITYVRHKIKALSVKYCFFFQNCIKICDMSEKVEILYK